MTRCVIYSCHAGSLCNCHKYICIGNLMLCHSHCGTSIPPLSECVWCTSRSSCAGPPNFYMSGVAASPITPRPLHHLSQSPHTFTEAAGGVMSGPPHTSSPIHLHHHSVAAAAAASPHGVNQSSLSVWTSQVI